MNPKATEIIKKDFIITAKKKGIEEPQKMQLTMNINFMHTTDLNKNRNFYVKSDNVEITPGSNINDVLIKSLESLLNNSQKEEQIQKWK